MSKVKQQWKPEEIEKLTQLTQSNRDNQREIDWKLIASQMENRTELQCKSYYQNILKKKLTTTMRKNHTWNRIELLMLFTLVVTHNGDFDIIQKHMPNFNAQQLKSQWVQIKLKLQQYTKDYQSVIQNSNIIQDIPDKQLQAEEYMLRIGNVRKYFIQHQDTGSVDTHYVQTYKAFWKTIDPSTLLVTYQNELVRRNLKKPDSEDTSYTNVDEYNQWIF
ncbi:Myb-like_DNA-binding domain-containing protein [Hexamita inflata]|uniref:Myb-like DNA-binding domain-containing protein n=1 Tax=Hexamita inflata TaxID=28002 RepID=A0AA86UUE5_9EUKA|nr:Myb-like DNA-binding domain-containing protein [Hexamita inflata]